MATLRFEITDRSFDWACGLAEAVAKISQTLTYRDIARITTIVACMHYDLTARGHDADVKVLLKTVLRKGVDQYRIEDPTAIELRDTLETYLETHRI
jgi:hypothetical protein